MQPTFSFAAFSISLDFVAHRIRAKTRGSRKKRRLTMGRPSLWVGKCSRTYVRDKMMKAKRARLKILALCSRKLSSVNV